MLTVPLRMGYTAALADLHRAGLRVWLSDDGVLRWQLGTLAGFVADDQCLADVVSSELAAADAQLFALRVAVPALAQAGATTDTPPDELGPLPFDDGDAPDDPVDEYLTAVYAQVHAAEQAAQEASKQSRSAWSAALAAHTHAIEAETARKYVDEAESRAESSAFLARRFQEVCSQNLADADQLQRDLQAAVTRAQVAAGEAGDAAARASIYLGQVEQHRERAELADSSAFTEHRAARSAAQRAGKFAADAEIQRVLVEQAGRAMRWPVLACWLAVPMAALACWLAGRAVRRRVS